MTIRVNSTSGINLSPMGSTKRSSGSFSLSGSQGATANAVPAKVGAMSGLMGMDALLALQGEEDVLTGRRRRQIKRSHSILDALDEVKVGLLGGDLDSQTLQKLRGMVAEQREDVDDLGLQSILDHIETRAAVELAKRNLM